MRLLLPFLLLFSFCYSKFTEIHNHEEYEEAIQSPKAFIFAYSVWNRPAKVARPILEAQMEKYPEVKFYAVDVDDVPDVSAELRIRAMPTSITYHDGEKLGEYLGANEKGLTSLLENLMAL